MMPQMRKKSSFLEQNVWLELDMFGSYTYKMLKSLKKKPHQEVSNIINHVQPVCKANINLIIWSMMGKKREREDRGKSRCREFQGKEKGKGIPKVHSYLTCSLGSDTHGSRDCSSSPAPKTRWETSFPRSIC